VPGQNAGDKGKDAKRPISNEKEKKGGKGKGAEEEEEVVEEQPKMSEEEMRLIQRCV
jgi:hypothetical protein